MFKKNECIVTKVNFGVGYFSSNFVYQQREDSSLLRVYKNNLCDEDDSLGINFEAKDRWRYASQAEIAEYNRLGKPFDVTTLNTKGTIIEGFPREGCCYERNLELQEYLKSTRSRISNKIDTVDCIGYSWDADKYCFVKTKRSSKREYKLNQLLKNSTGVEPPKVTLNPIVDDSTSDKIFVVHCINEQEWEFVRSKTTSDKTPSWQAATERMHIPNICLRADGSDWSRLGWYLESSKHTVLTFKEWCTKYGHTITPTFEIGKWYKIHYQGSPSYFKVLEIEDNCMSCEGTTITNKWDGKWHKYYSGMPSSSQVTLLNDLSEVQQYLPENHPDKIKTNSTMTSNDILKDLQQRYPVGTVVKCLVTGIVRTIAQNDRDYGFSNSAIAFKTTTDVHAYIYDVHDGKKLFAQILEEQYTPKVGDWIVITKGRTIFHPDMMNFVGEVVQITSINASGDTSFEGCKHWAWRYDWGHYRKALPHEIPKESPVSNAMTTELLQEMLLAEAKQKYPVGTIFECACDDIPYTVDDDDFDIDSDNDIDVQTDDGHAYVYYNGKWAEIIREAPSKTHSNAVEEVFSKITTQSLLQQAKELYPVGTKFVPAHKSMITTDEKYCVIADDCHFYESNGEIMSVLPNSRFYTFDETGEYGNVSFNRTVYSNGKWARIINDIPQPTISLLQEAKYRFPVGSKVLMTDDVTIVTIRPSHVISKWMSSSIHIQMESSLLYDGNRQKWATILEEPTSNVKRDTTTVSTFNENDKKASTQSIIDMMSNNDVKPTTRKDDVKTTLGLSKPKNIYL